MLSIIIPVYNVEKYLRQCLDSVYNLSIDKEVILVNDGSTDNSFEIMMEYKNKYEDITKVLDQKNGGASAGRNNGLKIATGEYVYFLDSDDWINEEEFLKSYSEILENKELDFVVSRNKIYLNETNEYRENLIKKEYNKNICNGKDAFIEIINKSFFIVNPPCFIFRKDFLDKNNLTYEIGRTHEDEIFTLKIYKNAKYVKILNNEIYFYRIHGESVMSTMNQKHVKSMFLNAKDLIKEFENEQNEEFKRAVFYKIKRYYRSALKYAYRNNYIDLYEEILKEFKKDCKNYFFKVRHYKFDVVEIMYVYLILQTKKYLNRRIFRLKKDIKKLFKSNYRSLRKKYRKEPIDIYAFIRVKNEIGTIGTCLKSIEGIITKGVIGYNKKDDEDDDGTEKVILDFCEKNKGFKAIRYPYDVIPANNKQYMELKKIKNENRLDTYYNYIFKYIPDDVWFMKIDCDHVFDREKLKGLKYLPKNDNDVIVFSRLNFHYMKDELYVINIHTIASNGEWTLCKKNKNISHRLETGFNTNGKFYAWELITDNNKGIMENKNVYYTDLFNWHFPFIKTSRKLNDEYFTSFDEYIFSKKMKNKYHISKDMLNKERILEICKQFKNQK